MKGVAFTLDALFALILAVAAISILLYFQFYPETPFVLKSTEAQLTLGVLSSTNLSTIAASSPVVYSMVAQSNAARQTWTQWGGNPAKTGSQPNGPLEPFISNIITANNLVSTPIAAANGNIYFGAGNTLYAYNQSGYLVWKNTTALAIKAGPVVYNQEVIYWNTQNVVALSAYNGSLVWIDSSLSSTSPAGPPLVFQNGIYLLAQNANIYELSPLNGTVIGTSGLGSGYARTIGTTSGSINYQYATMNQLILVQPRGSGPMYEVWALSLSSTSTAVASYSTYMGFGSNTAADLYDVNALAIATYNTGTAVTGAAVSSSGTFVYQSLGGLTALATNGVALWTSPSLSLKYGTALSGTTPVIGGGDIYTLWSHNYLTAENLSTGSVVWTTKIPYPALSPNMTLAYGRLWITAGNTIISYGSCNTNAFTNVFQAVTSLYINGQGSCADYLLSSLKPTSNYSVVSGQTFLAGQGIARFNGQNSYFITGGNYSPISTMSLSFWVYPTGPTGSNEVMVDSNPEGLWRVGFTASNSFYFDPGVGSTKTSLAKVSYNKWQFITVTAEDSFANTIYNFYVNGAKVTSGTITNNNIATIGNLTFSYPSFPFNGFIANVQLYNSYLSNSQIGLLYQGGAQSGTLSNAGLLSWWPLDGDGNDYGGQFNAAYPANVAYANANYVPQGLLNAYEIGKSTTLVPILNYSTGNTVLDSIGVDVWK